MRKNIEIKTAFILAAGLGTRMRPLTFFRPKPLLSIFNKPLIAWHIDYLISKGITHILVNVHHLKNTLKSFLIYYFYQRADSKNCRLTILEEETILGTGGALAPAKNHVEEDNFFLINSDIIHQFELKTFAKFHLTRHPFATLIVRETLEQQLKQICVNSKNEIIKAGSFVFQNEVPVKTLCFTGVHIVSRKVFDFCHLNRFQCILKDIYLNAFQKGESILAKETFDYWIDIGNINHFEQVHRDILTGRVKL